MPKGGHKGKKLHITPVGQPIKGYRKSELARLVSRSPAWIGTLCRNGDLECHDDGSVKKESAHAKFADEFGQPSDEMTERLEQIDSESNEIEAAVARMQSEISDDEGEPSQYNMAHSRARLTYWQSERTRLIVLSEQGALIDRAEAENTVSAAFQLVTDQFLSLGLRAASLVVGLSDEIEIQAILDREVGDIIRQLQADLDQFLVEPAA